MAHVDEETLLDLVHDAVIVRSRDGTILTWNRAAAERYSYRAQEAIGRTVEDLLTRTFRGDPVEETLARAGFWEGEAQVTSSDGRTLTCSCRQTVNGPSQVIEVHGPAIAMPADLRLVIDNLPGLVSYVDREFRYRLANRVYTEWFGKPEQEVLGAHVEDVLGVDAFAHVRPHMERALAGEFVRYETFLPYVHGRGKQVAVSYVPDRDAKAGVRGFVVLVEDNTARHQAEQSLRASESQYRQIVETAHEGIWIIGPDARTIFANKPMAELLGTTVEQLVNEHSFKYIFDEEVEPAGQLFATKMRGDREPFQFRLRRADGMPIWARISGVPMTDQDGRVTGLLGMFTDITAARAAERALRESEKRFRTLLANLPNIVSRFDRENSRRGRCPAATRPLFIRKAL